MEGRHYHINLAELHRLWMEDTHVDDIAKHFGVTKHVVYTIQRKYKLPPRGRVCRDHVEDPTPEQIEERAREIRLRRPEISAERVEAKQYEWNGRGWNAIP